MRFFRRRAGGGESSARGGRTQAPGTVQDQVAVEAFTRLAFALARASDLEGVLWAVAHEAIARLDLEDCVIYVVDDARKACVQRAAHGPKNPSGYDILDPIVIPLGKGLVGSVACSGKPERVEDVSRDPRYIVDDAARSSELTVPILHEGRVIAALGANAARDMRLARRLIESGQPVDPAALADPDRPLNRL